MLPFVLIIHSVVFLALYTHLDGYNGFIVFLQHPPIEYRMYSFEFIHTFVVGTITQLVILPPHIP